MQVCFRQVVSNGTSVLAIASGATCLSLGLLKLFSISLGIVTSHAITFRTLAVRTLNGTASERATNG